MVERLWEMSIESKNLDNDNFVLMTVNIMKKNGIKRFKAYTEMENALLNGYYIVAFEKIIELS